MTQTIVNLGTGGAVLNGQNGSTTSADSNDALFLDWPGDNAGNYVYLPGVSGNYLSVPDEAALDITGDIDIRVQVAMDDWTPGSISMLVGKASSYLFMILSDGRFNVWAYVPGFVGVASTVPTGLADGATSWVRVTISPSTGQVKFYLSPDGVAWTQLGTTVAIGTGSLTNSASDVQFGTTGGSYMAAGKFYRAQILNGIDGTKVLDVDTSVLTSGAATSFTATTGQTVTINRSTSGRKSVAVVSPCWLFGTDDYMEVASQPLIDFGATDSFTMLAVVRQWNTPGTDRVLWKGLNTTGPLWGLNITSSTELNLQLTDGTNYTTGNVAITTGAISVLAGIVNRSTGIGNSIVNNAYSTNKDVSGMGSLANSEVMRVGVAATGANYADMELIAVAVFRRALTSTEITTISNYYQARLS
jgi:hypothetical protein